VPEDAVHLLLVDLAVRLGGRDHGAQGEPFGLLGGDGRDVLLLRRGAGGELGAGRGLAARARVLQRREREGSEDRHGAAARGAAHGAAPASEQGAGDRADAAELRAGHAAGLGLAQEGLGRAARPPSGLA
jgi:hypothetical protein